ncbi:MAG TPA: hypothetical protein VJQ56_14095 [Blastocatellia bacterium]|nr:hypothetical protein [Blastocatellia bacterium]
MDKIVQSLAEQTQSEEIDKEIRERRRKVDLWLKIVGGVAASVVTGGVLWGVIYEVIIVKGELVTGFMLLGFIIGLILFALLMLYRESLEKRSARSDLAKPAGTQAPDTAKLLAESFVLPVGSVTERTTELIAADRKEDGE